MWNTNNKLNERLTLYILRSEWIISILSLYISTAADKETVWQTKLPGLVIISFILMILVKNLIVLLLTLRGWGIKESLWILAEEFFKSRTQTFNGQSVLTVSYMVGSG